MNIISSKQEGDRLTDGIHTSLSLPEDQFNLLIQKMAPSNGRLESLRFYYPTDNCEAPKNPLQLGLEQEFDESGNYISRAYFGSYPTPMHQILQECQNMLANYPPDSLEASRINELLHTRNLSAFKSYFSSTNDINPALLDKLFEILSDDDMLSKFLDYDNNAESFAINGQTVPIGEYLTHLGKIFGTKDSNGNLSNKTTISSDFFIPNLEEMKNRYSQIYDEINVDRYVNPYYTFSKTPSLTDTVVRDGDEPDWEIAPEVRDAIFSDMPSDLSVEEQAMYIYSKMCSIFSYDEGYLYRFNLYRVNYGSSFSQKHLEGIQPGDKITCFDFSRMYAKLVNEIDGDITAVMVLEGANSGHAHAGFYTDRVSVSLEAINLASERDATNDLMKAKNGIMLGGIHTISDREGIIKQALDKVYPQVLGKQPKTIRGYIQELKSLPQEPDVPNDVALKLQSFIETMKSSNIFGNEFTQTLWGIAKTNYFGDVKLERAYLGELREEGTDRERFVRHILLREPRQDGDDSHSKEVYLIDTETLDLTICSERDIIDRLNSGELIYEDEKRKLPGIDKEVSE